MPEIQPVIVHRRTCYLNAYNTLLKNPDVEMRLVHGLLQPKGNKEMTEPSGHAWLEGSHEGTPLALDPSNRLQLGAQLYRERAGCSLAIAYTRDEAQALVAQHGHTGPWDERVAHGLHHGKKKP